MTTTLPYTVKLLAGELMKGKCPPPGTEVVFSSVNGRLKGTITENSKKDLAWAVSGDITALLRRNTEHGLWQCLGSGSHLKGVSFNYNRDLDFPHEVPKEQPTKPITKRRKLRRKRKQ